MDVKRIIGTVILVGAALVMLLAGWVYFNDETLEPGDAPYWWRGTQTRGVVEKIGERELVLRTDKGPVTFTVNEMTRISMTGIHRYEAGATIKIKYKDIKSEKLARGIFVLKPEAGLAPSPAPMTASPGAAPASPGAPPASPGAPPASPGAPPASPGTAPASPAAPPASPGTAPASPGASPASPVAPPAAPPASPSAPPASPDASPASPGAPAPSGSPGA